MSELRANTVCLVLLPLMTTVELLRWSMEYCFRKVLGLECEGVWKVWLDWGFHGRNMDYGRQWRYSDTAEIASRLEGCGGG